MKITILLFGILRDVIGENSLHKVLADNISLEKLRQDLINEFPKLKNYNKYTIAVNEEYAATDYCIKENDVVALIPPVSGG